MGSNPVQGWIFFRLKFHKWLSCVHNCDDQSCLHVFLCSTNIWTFIYSFALFTLYGYIINLQSDQLPVGLIAQLTQQCTGILEVMGLNPVQASIFFRLIFFFFFANKGYLEQKIVFIGYTKPPYTTLIVEIYFEGNHFALRIIIICLAPWAGKMNRNSRCDLLPERARWSYLARSGYGLCPAKKIYHVLVFYPI